MSRRVEHQMEATFTVRQLREELEGADPDARVFFTCDYGDYHHTSQALPVGEIVDDLESNSLADSAYSQSGVQFVEEQELDVHSYGIKTSEADEDESFPIVILRS